MVSALDVVCTVEAVDRSLAEGEMPVEVTAGVMEALA
jgi:hypothetical protein